VWFVGKLVGLWVKLPAGAKGFTSGILAGLLLSAGISLLWPRHDPADRIALQNAKAALDSTRAIAAGHDTVFARLLAQKDVQIAGALGTVASLRGDNAKLSAKLVIVSAEHRTTESHSVPGGDAGAGEASGSQSPSVSDSLVLSGPPVEGTVGVTVTAQPDTTLRFDWDARLRPSPVHLEVGLGCGADGPELTAHGPAWTHVEIQPSEVEPGVCNPTMRVGVVRRGLEVVGGVTVGALIVKGVVTIIHLVH
jgi:hypothetical protein